MFLIYILILCLILWCIFVATSQPPSRMEGFNQGARLCNTCENKTFNQCVSCFDCSWCQDEFGSSGCIGGDVNGPYNNEKCARYYTSDDFYQMRQDNDHYKYSYGPRSSNRRIGINPC